MAWLIRNGYRLIIGSPAALYADTTICRN